MSEYIEKVLHVKSEDLRLYDLTDEENPVHLDNETRTVEDLTFTDGQKLLIESKQCPRHNALQLYSVCHCLTETLETLWTPWVSP